MHLLELHSEVQELVFETLVQDDIYEAFCVRGVNKHFKRMIENELLHKTPADRLFGWKILRGAEPVKSWAKKKHNVFEFLSYRTTARPGRPDSGQELPRFLTLVLDELLRFAPESIDLVQLRQRYMHDLLHALADHIAKLHISSGDNGDSLFNNAVAGYLEGKPLDEVVILAAAAIVDNTDAFSATYKHVESTAVLLEETVFGSPMYASVAGDSVPRVHYLLHELDTDRSWTDHWHNSRPDADKFLDYINSLLTGDFSGKGAISGNKIETAKYLLTFLDGDKYFDFDTYHGLPIDLMMKYGCIEIYEHACWLTTGHNSENWDIDLAQGIEDACKRGHADLVAHAMKGDLDIREIKGDYVYWHDWNSWDREEFDDPLLVAAAFSQVAVIDAFLQHDPSLLDQADVLEAAIIGVKHRYTDPKKYEHRDYKATGARYPITQQVIDHGVPVTEETIKLTNFYAEVFLKEEKMFADSAKTLLILLKTLADQFDKEWLQGKLLAPVQDALTRIINFNPEMRSERYDFDAMAADFHKWMTEDNWGSWEAAGEMLKIVWV